MLPYATDDVSDVDGEDKRGVLTPVPLPSNGGVASLIAGRRVR